ncbi:hypothetical protein [Novosphingobium sp. ZW T3_23]|uniref:hypothetical protein n=1 Tax=Novosphingobium sp. ZW T3_23 TaxID=3378084 RepID=UPI00385298ED
MSGVETLAAQLGADQKQAVMLLDGEWHAGPRLPCEVLDHLYALRNHSIVDRQFADDTPVTFSGDVDTMLTARVSACWHFRLTTIGLRLREYLIETGECP